MVTAGNPVPDTLFVFIDESGNFDFSSNGTRFFVMAAVAALSPLASAAEMQSLRYQLLASGVDLTGFHASEDRQTTRDAVFAAFARIATLRSHVIYGNEQHAKPLRIIGRWLSSSIRPSPGRSRASSSRP